MKIALLGYGKMGKFIEQVALERGHEIVLTVNSSNDDFVLTHAEVAIDFSTPHVAVNNISKCLKNGTAIVSGTTGWLDHYDSIVDLCKRSNGAFIYASNFSLGVNIFFELNAKLAKMIGHLDQYHARITEIHHTEKLDAPSGTAITLAKSIIDESNYDNWHLIGSDDSKSIPITAKRLADVTGTHEVTFTSEIDKISISHEAFNRKGFAVGAVIAAEWLLGKTGVFTMKDVLNIG